MSRLLGWINEQNAQFCKTCAGKKEGSRGPLGKATWPPGRCSAGFAGTCYGFFRSSNKMPVFALVPAAIAGSSTLNFGL